jgi:hypothetical protein
MTPRLTFLVSLSLVDLGLRIFALVAVFVELSRADVGRGGAGGGVGLVGVGVVCGGVDGCHFGCFDVVYVIGIYEEELIKD